MMEYTHYTLVMRNGQFATVRAKYLYDRGVLVTTLGQVSVDHRAVEAAGIDSFDGFYSHEQSRAHIAKLKPLLRQIAEGSQ